MKVLDLQCTHSHDFEGWFASGEDFESQHARGLVECPVCGSREIVKRLSAPRLNFGSGEPPQRVAAEGGADSPEAHWLRAVRKLMAETEDVGERFTDEARRIHYGEAPERGIRGQATGEQRRELLEEGIAVVSVPLPAALKGPLQ